MIKIIIGLGNPGTQYHRTRHNVGWRVVDMLAERYGAVWKERDDREESEISIDGRVIKLIKPLTFMNNSGAVIPALLRPGIGPENLLVVHDELELPLGKTALKTGGSAHGHNGLKSIIAACGKDFMRLRCGVGRPPEGVDVAAYVLSPFEDKVQAEKLVTDACDLVVRTLETDQKI